MEKKQLYKEGLLEDFVDDGQTRYGTTHAIENDWIK